MADLCPDSRRDGRVAALGEDSRTGPWHILFAQPAQHLFVGQLLQIKWQRAHQHLIEHHAQRVHIGAGIDILATRVGLLRAHVFERAQYCAHARKYAAICEPLRSSLGQTEVDDPGHRLAIHVAHQNVRRLQVAMDDGLLVRVLHSFADLDEEFHPLSRVQLVPVAVSSNGRARDVLHGEVGPSLGRGAGIENLGDRRMIHQRQCLPLRLETRHHFARIHACLDQLDGDPAAHRLLLLCEPNLAHAALANELKQIIGVDFAVRRPALRQWSARR